MQCVEAECGATNRNLRKSLVEAYAYNPKTLHF